MTRERNAQRPGDQSLVESSLSTTNATIHLAESKLPAPPNPSPSQLPTLPEEDARNIMGHPGWTTRAIYPLDNKHCTPILQGWQFQRRRRTNKTRKTRMTRDETRRARTNTQTDKHMDRNFRPAKLTSRQGVLPLVEEERWMELVLLTAGQHASEVRPDLTRTSKVTDARHEPRHAGIRRS